MYPEDEAGVVHLLETTAHPARAKSPPALEQSAVAVPRYPAAQPTVQLASEIAPEPVSQLPML